MRKICFLSLFFFSFLICFSQNKVDSFSNADAGHYVFVKDSEQISNTLNKLFFVIVGIIATIVAQPVIVIIKKKISEYNELMLLKGELEDIQRHCAANIVVFENIDISDLSQNRPAPMHFEKMKIHDDSAIFSLTTFKNINPKYAKVIYNLKLVIRNFNIEIEEAKKYSSSADYDPATLEEYMIHLINKNVYLKSNRIQELINFIDKKDLLTDIHMQPSWPRKIIYLKPNKSQTV